jgi:uncharacterized YigZ family protein
MSDIYLVPSAEVRIEHVVLNSRFIATLAPTDTDVRARAFITHLRHEFPDASHHVSAFIVGGGKSTVEYCSDDGEPSGTAGRPLLSVLRGSGLGDVALVVTRYFGGTLLGKGGLVRAYTESAQLAVRAVSRARKMLFYRTSMELPYNKLDQIRATIKSLSGQIESEEFAEIVRMKLVLPVDVFPEFENTVSDLTSGSVHPKVISEVEIQVPVDRKP